MSSRKILLAGSSAAALFLAYQTIHAVGSHVPIDERVWVPPTVAAGLEDSTAWTLAAHHGPHHPEQVAFDLTGRGKVNAPLVPTVEGVDLSALAVFAATGNDAALDAEVARIRAVQPDFVVPDDIADRARTEAEDGIWALVAEGKFADARAVVAAKEARGNYRPSGSLMREIGVGEAAASIRAASLAGDYPKAIELAEGEEAVLTCARLQVVWDVADALAQTGAADRSEEVYRFALDNCADAQARSATLQKAAASLGPDAGARLTRVAGQLDPDVAGDGHRATLAAWLDDGEGNDDTLLRNGCGVDRLGAAINAQREQTPLSVEVERSARALAATTQDPEVFEQLGWYHMRTDRLTDAGQWFQRALASDGSDGAVEGLVMVLRRTGQRVEARNVALAESERSERIACLYVDLASEDLATGSLTEIGDLARLTTEVRSPNAAATLGWHHEKGRELKKARDWFDLSVQWGASESGVMGLAVTQHKLGNTRAVERLAKAHRFAAVRDFAKDVKRGVPLPRTKPVPVVEPGPSITDVLLQDAIAAYDRSEYDVAAALLNRRRMQVGEARDVAMLRGWALHNSGRSGDALKLFRALHKAQPSDETRVAMHHSRQSLRSRRGR